MLQGIALEDNLADASESQSRKIAGNRLVRRKADLLRDAQLLQGRDEVVPIGMEGPGARQFLFRPIALEALPARITRRMLYGLDDVLPQKRDGAMTGCFLGGPVAGSDEGELFENDRGADLAGRTAFASGHLQGKARELVLQTDRQAHNRSRFERTFIQPFQDPRLDSAPSLAFGAVGADKKVVDIKRTQLVGLEPSRHFSDKIPSRVLDLQVLEQEFPEALGVHLRQGLVENSGGRRSFRFLPLLNWHDRGRSLALDEHLFLQPMLDASGFRADRLELALRIRRVLFLNERV